MPNRFQDWKTDNPAIWISFKYLVIASLWIFLSDQLLFSIDVLDEEGLIMYQTLKGLFFVTATSLMLYFFIRKQFFLLRRNRDLFRSIFNSLDDAVFFIDPEGRTIKNCNDAVKHVFGYEPEELIGKSSVVLHVDEEQYRTFGKKSQPDLQEKGYFEIEFVMKRKDNRKINTRIFVAPIVQNEWQQGVISVVKDVTREKERINEIEKNRRDLRRLAHKLQYGIEKERRRFARELHDNLGQQFVILKMRLKMLLTQILEKDPRQEEVKKEFEDINSVLDKTSRISRKLIEDLRPGEIESLGLNGALENLCHDFANKAKISCRFLTETDEKIPHDIAIAIYRITQESLSNVAKHAAAKNVLVKLFKNTDQLTIMIKDDGRGFKKTDGDKENTFGLLGIRERANMFRGRSNIRSTKKGTTVEVNFPLKGNDNDPDMHR